MQRVLFLAVAATLAGCHHRTEPQTGAAPAPTAVDTAAVTHQVDPNRTGPPGTGGRAPTGTVNVDSVGLDTSKVRVDSTTKAPPPSAPQDTLGPRATDTTATDTSTTAR